MWLTKIFKKKRIPAHLNRSSVIVNKKKPFLKWVNADPKGSTFKLKEINEENHIYLIDVYYDNEHLKEILKGVYEYIFENELEGWCTDSSMWPHNRDWELFNKWLEVKPHSMVYDVCTNDFDFFD